MVFKSKWITSDEFVRCKRFDILHKEHDRSRVEKSDAPVNSHFFFVKSFKAELGYDYTLDISADDCYKLYVNNTYVAEGPSPSYCFSYSHNRIDISKYIRRGKNTIAVHVYYQGLINRVLCSGDGRMGLVADLYRNGEFLLGTDESWICREAKEYTSGGIIGYDTQFLENIDFTRRKTGNFDGSGDGWEHAVHIEDDGHIFREMTDDTVKVNKKLPVRTVKTQNGYFIDFGREIVGRFYMVAGGAKYDRVRIMCGEETLEEDSQSVRYKMRNGCTYFEECTLSGGEDEFDFYDYKAFRYVNVEGSDGIMPESFCAYVRHRAFDDSKGHIRTNSRELADIWNLCRNTVKYATQENFLDCPTREKGQYLGDFLISGLAHLCITKDSEAYRKALYDFAASSVICPGLMSVCPGSHMQEIADFSLEYPLALLNYYNRTKDIETLRDLYPALEGLIAHFEGFTGEDGLLYGVTDKWNLVDWPDNLRDGYDFTLNNPIDPDACHNVINAHMVGALIVFKKISDILGYDIGKHAERAVKAFNEAFFDTGSGLYTDRPVREYERTGKAKHMSLHSNVLPAFYGFCHPDSKKNIASLIEEKEFSCGVQFAYFVLGACSKLERFDLEYKLLISTREHSWINMLRQGATTTFEAWGKDQKWNTSLCHPWGCSPIVAIYDDIMHNCPDGVEIEIYDEKN